MAEPVENTVATESAVADESTAEQPDEQPDGDPVAVAPVVALFAGELEDRAEPKRAKPRVDDLFAKLRAAEQDAQPVDAASTTDLAAVTEPEPTAAAAGDPAVSHEQDATTEWSAGDVTAAEVAAELAESDESPFLDRDEALAPLEVALSRRFKRALADEQNDVLDVLRRKDPVRTLADLLPSNTDQVTPYLVALREELPAAAIAGARSVSEEEAERLARRVNDAGVVQDCEVVVSRDIVEPLRSRLEHAIAEADGDNSAIAQTVRVLYREWKTQLLDELAEQLVRRAYARGAYAAIVPGTPVRWVPDPVSRCAHEDANVSNQPVRAGDRFPGGEVSPPSAPACRCLLVVIDR
ncbi:MAG: hypothetical protein R2715_18055 [Ilumatobacteraceae bacterium]